MTFADLMEVIHIAFWVWTAVACLSAFAATMLCVWVGARIADRISARYWAWQLHCDWTEDET